MKIRVTSTTNLIAFLKKLKVVDRSVLLELTKDRLFSKVHTPDKSVMKYASINISDVFDVIKDIDDIHGDRIKIGLMDVGKFIDCFKHFRTEEEIFLDLKLYEGEEETITSELKVISNSLKIRIRCADLSLLSYVDDEVLELVHSKEAPMGKFKIYNSDFASVMSLCGLESNSEELLVCRVNTKEVRITGDSFDYKLNINNAEITTSSDMDVAIYKSHLNYVDSETSECYIHDNRIIFFSEQSETSTAVGVIEE